MTSEVLARIQPELIGQALRFPRVYQAYQDLYAVPRTAEQQAEQQTQRLDTLLRQVLTDVPAWRDLGISPTDDPHELLRSLPRLTKEQITDDLSAHVSDQLDPAQCLAVVTSGTTGRPLRIIHSAEHLIHSAATELARQTAYGLPFDRKTLQPFKLGGAGWLEYTVVNTGFTRVAEFGFLDELGKAARAEIARRCVAFAPDAVFSHPTRIAGLVELLLEAGIDHLAVPVIRTFGETLTQPLRDLFSDFFGGKIRNQYALNEVSTVASECDHGTMHVDTHRLWVEILDADGTPVPPGVPGEVTVTNFFNPVMPFVRYRTDDIAAWSGEPCGCGDPAPTLSLIAGRDHGAIAFGDGTSIDALRVVRAVEHVPLSRLQVIQDEHGLTILVSPLPHAPDDGLERRPGGWVDGRGSCAGGVAAAVEEAVRSVVGDRLAITVREAAEADFHRTGRREKTPSFVSLVPTSVR